MNFEKSLGIDKRVTFIECQENSYSYIGNADLFVLSSVSEGFPNVLVEVMACGRAVVASNCKTGSKEILSNNVKEVKEITYAEYGILVPHLNAKEDYTTYIDDGDKYLADAIELLVLDENLRGIYEKNARKRANDFSYDKCRQKYLNLLGG